MTEPRNKPTDAQLAILNVLWSRGSSTVREVHEDLPGELRRGYTTTLKLMQIMAEKGLVERNESARSHVYTAAVERGRLQDTLVGDLLDKAFGGSAAKLAMRALSSAPTSAEELAEIRELLARLEGGAASRPRSPMSRPQAARSRNPKSQARRKKS